MSICQDHVLLISFICNLAVYRVMFTSCLAGCLTVLACPPAPCPPAPGTAARAMSEGGSLHGLPVTADSLDASNTASSKFSDALEGSENSGWMFLRGRAVVLGVVLTAGDGLGLLVCWWGVRGAKRVLGVSCWEGVAEEASCLQRGRSGHGQGACKEGGQDIGRAGGGRHYLVLRVEGEELAET